MPRQEKSGQPSRPRVATKRSPPVGPTNTFFDDLRTALLHDIRTHGLPCTTLGVTLSRWEVPENIVFEQIPTLRDPDPTPESRKKLRPDVALECTLGFVDLTAASTTFNPEKMSVATGPDGKPFPTSTISSDIAFIDRIVATRDAKGKCVRGERAQARNVNSQVKSGLNAMKQYQNATISAHFWVGATRSGGPKETLYFTVDIASQFEPRIPSHYTRRNTYLLKTPFNLNK